MKGETGPGAGLLGLSQSIPRRDQDLPITIESYNNTVWTNGLRYRYRVTTSPDRSINNHEPTAEFEDRQRWLQQHRQMQREPIPVRFTIITTSVRARIQCATSLDHPAAVAEYTP